VDETGSGLHQIAMLKLWLLLSLLKYKKHIQF